MKNIIIYTVLSITLMSSNLMAEEKKISMALGGIISTDAIENETGKGGYIELAYSLHPDFEILLHGSKLVSFKVKNNLTEDDIDISMVTVGARYLSKKRGNSRGYAGFDIGAMKLDSDNSISDDSKTGGAARFHAGAEQYISEDTGIRLGAGYTKGTGTVNEVSFFDFNLGFFIRL